MEETKKRTRKAATTTTDTTDTTTDTTNTPRKVIVLGTTLIPKSKESLQSYVAARAARQFPDFTSKLPEGKYITTGEFTTYSFVRPGERPVELLVAFIENAITKESSIIGSWEFSPRLRALHIGAEDIAPEWVLDEQVNNIERDKAVLNIPGGTEVFCHRGKGYAINPLVQPTRERTITWFSKS